MGKNSRWSKEKWRTFLWNNVLTFFVVSSFLGGACCFVAIGITISDLAENTNSTEVTIGYIFVVKAAGMLIAGLFVGTICDVCTKITNTKTKFYYPSLKWVFLCGILLMTIPTYFTPILKQSWIVISGSFFMGFGFQFLLVVNTVLIDTIWKDFSKLIINGYQFVLHFIFGISSFSYTLFGSLVYSWSLSSYSNITIIYGIGYLSMFIPLSFIFFTSPEKEFTTTMKGKEAKIETNNADSPKGEEVSEKSESTTPIIHESKENDENSKETPTNTKQTKKTRETKKKHFIFRIFFVVFALLLMTTYVSIDAIAGFLIFLYCSKNNISKSQSSLVTSLFYGFYTLGRFVGVMFSFFTPPFLILFIDIIGLLITYIFFTIFPNHMVSIIICIAGISFFISTMFSSIIGISKMYKIEFTGVENSIVIFGCSLGNFVPFGINYLMDVWIKEVYVYSNLILSICLLVFFVFYNLFGVLYLVFERKSGNKNKIFVQSAGETSEKDPKQVLEMK